MFKVNNQYNQPDNVTCVLGIESIQHYTALAAIVAIKGTKSWKKS